MEDDKVLEILKMISHPTRLEILRKIQSLNEPNGVSCSVVLDGLEISQSTFSHHISEMAQSGLITTRAHGRFNLIAIDELVWNDFQSKLKKVVLG